MTAQLPALVSPDPWATLYEPAAFQQAELTAATLARCLLVPKHLRDNPESIVMALAIARGMGENPIHVLQSIYFVQGRPGWSAQYLIAKVNGSGLLRGPIRYRVEGEGKSLAVTAYATLREPDGEQVSFTVSMAMADAEGWSQRNPKYRTCPDLMLRYRAATLLARTHFPHVLMGFYERNELVDTFGEEPEYIDPLPPRASTRQHSGAGSAEPCTGGSRLQDSVREAGNPPLALPSPASPLEQVAVEESATPSTAVPSGEDTGATCVGEPGSTPGAPATASSTSAPARAQSSTPGDGASAQGAGPDDVRNALLQKVAQLREQCPDLLREVAKPMGLSSPAKAPTLRLRELVERVQLRLALAKLRDEELLQRLDRAEQAAIAHVGPEDTLSLAQAAGLPVGPEGPVVDGAPRAMLERYLVALEQVVQP